MDIRARWPARQRLALFPNKLLDGPHCRTYCRIEGAWDNTQPAVFGLMDAANDVNAAFDFKALCRLLEDHESDVVDWLRQREKASPEALGVVLELVRYDRDVVRSVRPSVWFSLAHARKLWSPSVFTQTKSALAIAALESETWAGGGELMAGSFEDVHHHLVKDNLPWRIWSELRHCVPELHWRDNWDKGERFRQAVLNRFASGAWPKDRFFDVVSTKEAFQYMVGSNVLNAEQAAVLRVIIDKIASGASPAPSWLSAGSLKL